jgi:Domain of unknown function (DUF4960)/Secretion system C-terminal sorting domain
MKRLITTRMAQMVALLFISVSSMIAQKVCLVGTAATVAALDAEEQGAYNWAITKYGADAQYKSFADINTNGVPATTRVVWYHLHATQTVSADAVTAASKVEAYLNRGGGMFLSGFGTKYVVNTNVTAVGPTETISNNTAVPDSAWGFRPTPGRESHPVFKGMTLSRWPDPNWGGYRTIKQGIQTNEILAWWTGGTLPGNQLASLPWIGFGNNLATLGELSKGTAKIIVASAPGFAWERRGGTSNGTGEEQTNLDRLTSNILSYVQSATSIAFLGTPAAVGSLLLEEKAAWDWAAARYGNDITYLPFSTISASGIPAGITTLWYHAHSTAAAASITVPADAVAAAPKVEAFVTKGGGLFLSGFGTKYAATINAGIAPTETISNTSATADSAWGFRPTPGQEAHPVFAGMTVSKFPDANWGGYRTVKAAVQTNEILAWWTGGSFTGTQLAGLPWQGAGSNLAILGELKKGFGTVIVASAPGYAWERRAGTSNGTGEEQSNLDKLTNNILRYTQTKPSIALVGSASDTSGLGIEEKAAYAWALNTYGSSAAYMPFAQIANGVPANVKTIWYHSQTPDLPADAVGAAAKVDSFTSKGGGLVLTGFGTKYVVPTKITTVGPTETISNPTAVADGAWGIRPSVGKEIHPLFAGITPTTAADWGNPDWGGFRTIKAGTAAAEILGWWTNGSFPGTQLGGMSWQANTTNLAVLGELQKGQGGAVVCSAPAYVWQRRNGTVNGAVEQANLELFTKNMLAYANTFRESQTLKVTIDSSAAVIVEGTEGGKKIHVDLVNAAYQATLTPAKWVVRNIPAGLAYTISRVSNTRADITLAGTATYYATDITNFTVKVPKAEIFNLRTGDTLSSVGALTFKAVLKPEATYGNIALVGTEATIATLDNDEKAAYNWAIATYGRQVKYYNITDLVLDTTLFRKDTITAIWWHFNKFTDLPLVFDNQNTARMVHRANQKGVGLFLSGGAPQYVSKIRESSTIAPSLTTKGPNETAKANPPFTNPDHWGYGMKEPNHPIFRNLPNPFFTLYSPTGLREDYKSWWNLDVPFETRPPADRFDGRYLASTEWDGSFKILCTVAEFGSKVKAVGDTTGRVICVGAGAYDWYLDAGTNADRPQLEAFTTNILNYIRPTRNFRTGTKDITELMTLSVYPNPANETVNFGYTLKQSGTVKIHIYDLQGREISQITEGSKTTGTHIARWNTVSTAAGMYIYRIESGNEAATGRITIMNK